VSEIFPLNYSIDCIEIQRGKREGEEEKESERKREREVIEIERYSTTFLAELVEETY